MYASFLLIKKLENIANFINEMYNLLTKKKGIIND